MTAKQLAMREPSAIQRIPGDLSYIEDVVRVNFPIHAARAYLRRHMGNIVRYKLVEALRGERVGHVRCAEILPAAGGEPMLIRGLRVLPDGAPASFYTPEDLVRLKTELLVAAGGQPFSITPNDEVLLHVPVRGYTRYLPAIFQGGAPTQRRDVVRADEVSARRWGARDEVSATDVGVDSADTFRRFLCIFQHLMTTVVEKVERIPSLTDPISADPNFLPWIASWVNFELDGSLPVHQQRELVRRAIRLYRSRGTREGIEEMVKVLTSAPVTVLEREKPPPAVLGAAPLAGGATFARRFLAGEPPAHFMTAPQQPATRFFVLLLEPRERFEKRFGERATDVLRRIAHIVTTEKPAHVQFTIRFGEA